MGCITQIDFAVGEHITSGCGRGLELQGFDGADTCKTFGGDNHLAIAVVIHGIARNITDGRIAGISVADGDGVAVVAGDFNR